MDVNWRGVVPALMTGHGSEHVRSPRLAMIREECAKVEAIAGRTIETRPLMAA
ncbi:MAG: hypothetical protein GVX90_01755 [Alphaproteobacteria bacterium]|jgi:hypothetical protein|nr:hypothetical protein [Alphaproteobacteria bacterium]